MREKPILFSAPMVRAILDGRKTVTRRVVKARQFPAPFHQRCLAEGVDVALREMYEQGRFDDRPFPYGQPGDRLWVRETWTLEDRGSDGQRIVWASDRSARWMLHGEDSDVFYLPSDHDPRPWRPSIHMPRWASRLTLEVVSVRVERLHDITEEDAKAEGVEAAPFCKAGRPNGLEHVEAFEDLWNAINGAESWDANPWVWRVEFKVMKGGTHA